MAIQILAVLMVASAAAVISYQRAYELATSHSEMASPPVAVHRRRLNLGRMMRRESPEPSA